MKISIFDFGEICFKIMKKYHLMMKKKFLRIFNILFDLARPDDHKSAFWAKNRFRSRDKLESPIFCL